MASADAMYSAVERCLDNQRPLGLTTMAKKKKAAKKKTKKAAKKRR